MSLLKNKSELNRAAADFLQKQSYFPSVIHCAYYSCIQLVKHIMINALGKTEIAMNTERRNAELGIHEYLINHINTELKSKNKDWKTFNDNITQLKKLRISADYEEVAIDSAKGSSSIRLSDVVLRHLRTNFTV